MAKASRYYYDQLNKEQQKAYYAMKTGLLNLQDSFAVPMVSKKELSDIYFMLRMDCPEIFYSVTFSYRYYADSTAVEMIPKYLFSKDKIKEHRQAMESRVKKLTRQAANLNEKEKELFIHDFIAENVKGLMTLHKGEIFKRIYKAFEDAGYTLSYRLLNAADYGVPQKRERMIMVGFRNDLGIKFEFPEETNKNNWVPLSVAVQKLAIDEQKYYFYPFFHF